MRCSRSFRWRILEVACQLKQENEEDGGNRKTFRVQDNERSRAFEVIGSCLFMPFV